MDTHTGQPQVEQPRLSPTSSPDLPAAPPLGGSQRQDKAASAGRARPGSRISPGPDPVPKDLGDVRSNEETSGWAPIAPVPGVPAGRLCSPVQHFADPLAHASPGGGGQAPAAAAFSWQVLDGGHHMVRRGRRRWRLQLGLRRLGGNHRGGGGGERLSERCRAHSARAPGPGTRREPGQAAPAREAVPPAKRRRGEAPAAPAAASRRSALGLLPGPGRTPPLRAASSRPGSSLAATQVLAHPAKWLRRGSAGTRSCRVQGKDCAERGTRLPGFAFCPGAQGLSWRWQLRWRCFSWCRLR